MSRSPLSRNSFSRTFIPMLALLACASFGALPAHAADAVSAENGGASVGGTGGSPQGEAAEVPIGESGSAPAGEAGAKTADENSFQFTWGFRERIRQTYIVNPFDLDDDSADDLNFFRVRSQLWFDLKAARGLELYAMINNEHRHYMKPDRDFDIDEFILENLYIKAHRIGGSPATLVIGRQNMMLDEGFIYMDGGPLDGSRTAYMNAARLILEWEKRSVEAHFLFNPKRDEYVPRVNSKRKPLIEHDELGAGLRLTEGSLPKTKLTGYYVYKEERSYEGDVRVLDNTIHTIGGRIVGTPLDGLRLVGEGAYQLWDFDEGNENAFGGYAYGTYSPEISMKPSFTIGYIYLSGKEMAEDRWSYVPNEFTGWDPLFSRWPKWSELYIYTLLRENGIAYWSNLKAPYMEIKVRPLEQVALRASVFDLSAPYVAPGIRVSKVGEPLMHMRDMLFGDGTDRGLLTIVKLDWNVTKYLSGHFLWERFEPQDFYGYNRDVSHFLRWELYFKY